MSVSKDPKTDPGMQNLEKEASRQIKFRDDEEWKEGENTPKDSCVAACNFHLFEESKKKWNLNSIIMKSSE